MTIAAFTFQCAFFNSLSESSYSRPVTMFTMRRARSFSFSEPVWTSTIRLPYVFPMRTIAPVVSMLSTILVAVPALRRVEPAITSAPTPGDRARAFLVVVLDAFLRGEDRAASPGHDGLHQRRVRAEGRRHFGGLEDAEPAARAGADEDDASLFPERAGDHLDADGNALVLALDRREHLAVLAEHQFDDVAGGELVDSECRGVDGFGREGLPLRAHRHNFATILQSRALQLASFARGQPRLMPT